MSAVNRLWKRIKIVYFSEFYRAIFACSVVMMSLAYTSVYPYTYLPSMIRWFGKSEEDKGYYAGFISSAYFTGSALFAYIWGWLADKKDRRILLMILLSFTAIFCLIFGFCWNFLSAILIRFLDGVVNGIHCVVYALVYNYTNNANQSKATTAIETAWGIGICLTPLIGGYLAEPVRKYPRYFSDSGIFGKFPYLLPSLVGCMVACLACLVVFVFLPNRPSNDEQRLPLIDNFEMETAEDNSNISLETVEIPSTNRQEICVKQETNKNPDSKRKCKQHHLNPQTTTHNALVAYSAVSSRLKKIKNNTWDVLSQYPHLWLIVVGFFCFKFGTLGYLEILPVALSTDKSLGGMSFSTNNIGTVLGSTAFLGIVLQMFLVVYLEKRFGAIISYVTLLCVLIVCIQTTFLCRLIKTNWATWTFIYIYTFLNATCLIACNVFFIMIVNNCARTVHAGSVNGVAQGFGAIGKAASPAIGGNIFSASIISSLGPPVDSSTVFVFMGFILLLSVISVYCLPRNLNKQNKEITTNV